MVANRTLSGINCGIVIRYTKSLKENVLFELEILLHSMKLNFVIHMKIIEQRVFVVFQFLFKVKNLIFCILV